MIDRYLSKTARILRDQGLRSFGSHSYFFLLNRTYPSIESGCIKINSLLPILDLFTSVDGILMYHGVGQDCSDLYGNIPPSKLERDLHDLSSDFDFVSLSQITQPEDRTRIALTFDDGLKSFYDNALPILRELEIPATVFVNPGFIGDSNRSKIESAHEIESGGRITMTHDELMGLVDDELIAIGNHGMFHRRLDDITDEDELYAEIVESKTLLEEELGVQPNAFCYAYGSYSPSAVELVKDEYDLAVSSELYTVSTHSDPYLLPRIAAHEELESVRWQLNPIRDTLKNTLRVPEHAQELGW